MRSIMRAMALVAIAASQGLGAGCGGGASAQDDQQPVKDKPTPPTLQPGSAPIIRPSIPSSPPSILKPSSPAPSSPAAPAKSENPPRGNDSRRTESSGEKRDAIRIPFDGKPGTFEIPGGGSGRIRIEGFNPGGSNNNRPDRRRDDERRRDEERPRGERREGGNGGGPSRGGNDDNRSRPGGSEIPGVPGFGGDSARKHKSPPIPDGMPGWFKDNDKDGDGQVAMFEWPRDDMDGFTKYDRNGDGFITIAEAMRFAPKPVAPVVADSSGAPATPPAAPAAPPSAPATPGGPIVVGPGGGGDERTRQISQDLFRRYDRNNDGKLDQQEIQNTRTLRFSWQQHDTNKDNMIDSEEMFAFMKTSPGGGFGGPGGGGFGGPGGGGPGGLNMQNNEDRMKFAIARFDRNGDLKLTREEFPRFFGGPERFDQLDTNRDGFIDVPEFSKAMESLTGGGRGGFGGGGGGGRGPGR